MLLMYDFFLVTALGVVPLSGHAFVTGVTHAILANYTIFSHPGSTV